MKFKIILVILALILFTGCTGEDGEAALLEKISDLKADTGELLEQNAGLRSDVEHLQQSLSEVESIVSSCVEKPGWWINRAGRRADARHEGALPA